MFAGRYRNTSLFFLNLFYYYHQFIYINITTNKLNISFILIILLKAIKFNIFN